MSTATSRLAEARTSARLHWLVVGDFGSSAGPAVFGVRRSEFSRVLEERAPAVVVSAAEEGASPVEVHWTSLGQLRLSALVQRLPVAARLSALAESLRAGRTPDADALAKELAEDLSLPSLAGRVRELLEQDAAAASERPGTSSDGSGPGRAIDAFVRSSRSGAPAVRRRATRKVSELLEDEAMLQAARIAASPQLQRVEGAWRGLWHVLQQAPDDVLVEVHEAREPALQVLREREEEPEFDQPDAVFVLDPVTDLDALRELGAWAEGRLHPCVVASEPSLWGADSVEALGRAVEEPSALEGLEAWQSLRTEEAARWLSVVVNPMLAFTEGAGAGRRHVWASPVWALAAMLTASHARHGVLGRILGREAQVAAPAVTTLDSGVAAPSRELVPLRTQARLAALGVAAVGSARNTDKLVLGACPTVYGGPEAVPLPAQVVTGRIVRFARWIAEELPADIDAEELAQSFSDASRALLFPGQERAARVMAEPGQPGYVHVEAKVSASVAATTLELAFDLPLGG